MNLTESQPTRRNRGILLTILLVCLLPLLGALYFRFVSPPTQFRIAGEALSAQQLSVAAWTLRAPLVEAAGKPLAEALGDRWLVAHVARRSCDADCSSRLHLTRQARVAMYKNITRVQRVLFLADELEIPTVVAEHGDLALLRLPSDQSLADLREDRIYLIDRRGYLVFRYDGATPPKEFIRDLERLIKF